MNKEALDKLTDGPHMLLGISNELSDLAGAFNETGNERIASRLSFLVKNLHAARKMIEEGRNEALNHAVRVSEEATGNMVRAALAGVLGPR